MFTIRRISTTPNTPLSILVDGTASQADGDGGFALGGHFMFYPKGSEDGDTSYQMSEHAARIIMGDPSLAPHFECTPDLDAKAEPAEQAQPDSADAGYRGGRRRGMTKAAADDDSAT